MNEGKDEHAIGERAERDRVGRKSPEDDTADWGLQHGGGWPYHPRVRRLNNRREDRLDFGDKVIA